MAWMCWVRDDCTGVGAPIECAQQWAAVGRPLGDGVCLAVRAQDQEIGGARVSGSGAGQGGATGGETGSQGRLDWQGLNASSSRAGAERVPVLEAVQVASAAQHTGGRGFVPLLEKPFCHLQRFSEGGLRLHVLSWLMIPCRTHFTDGETKAEKGGYLAGDMRW